MASDIDFVRFVVDQVDPGCELSYRKMFGEYAVYMNGKVVALICDNQLFVKPTEAGRAHIDAVGEVVEAPPYPGAKHAFLVGDEMEDGEWLTGLFVVTENELPAPKPKKKRKKTPKKKGTS